jgi:precorrin-6B methylase 2
MLKTAAGRCLFEAPDGIKVYQNYLYRWLTINSDIIQTLIHRRHPEKASLDYIRPLTIGACWEPGDCCLLGLGGAGVLHHLAPYLKSSRLVAVENNAEIIKVANSHFMINRLKNLSIVHQNADQFVQHSTTLFRHLIVDLFDSVTFPINCHRYDFIVRCKRLLQPQGIFAMNLTHLHTNRELFRWVRQVFFQNTILLPVKNSTNIILIAFNDAKTLLSLDKIKNSIPLKKFIWDTEWGLMAELK